MSMEHDITTVLNGSGLAAKPAADPPQAYGMNQNAAEVASAIENACEATIRKMYDSVEQNEAMVRDQRKKVDDFAVVLRNYYKAHVGSLSEFLAHLQRTSDELTAHVDGFAERLRAGGYPRADQ
jgi:hypothetical protein